MNGTDIIVKCYGIAYESTGFLVAGLYIIRFCFSIGIAKLCAARPDWRRGIFITICILFSASLIAMYFLPLVSQPTTLHYAVITVFFIMLSMSLSSLTALSTLVSNLVPAKMTGTAWAIVSVAIDVCECVMSLSIIWLLNDNGKTLPQLYQNSLLFFFIVSLGNVVVSLVFLTPEFEVFDYTLRELEEGRK